MPRLRTSHGVAASVAALAVAWACTTPGPVDPGPPPARDGSVKDAGVDGGRALDGGLPVRLACGVLTAQRCAYLQRCALIGSAESELRACEALYAATWCGPSQWSSRADPTIATLRYDAVRALVCADAFETRACADFATLPDACERFLSPNAQLHQACYGGFQECQEGVCRGASCPRSCLLRGGKGDVCATDSDCQSDRGYFCRGTSTPGVGLCTSLGGTGDVCSSALPCGIGLTCNDEVCAVLPTSTEPCLAGRCDNTAWCARSPDGGTCEPRRNTGALCTDDVQCLGGDLCETLSGQCAPVLLKQAGAPCGPRQVCPDGMTCLGLTASSGGACLAVRKLGEPCAQSADCQAHLACVAADGGLSCQGRGLATARCDTERDCAPFLVCAAHACTPLGTPGGDCGATRRCLWGPCTDLGDGGFLCAEPAGPGVPCGADTDCASHRCVQGQCVAACAP